MDKLTTFFVKFADNAHLGKIATDFAPGIILTTTILLLLGSYSELEIFPYTKRAQYQSRMQEAKNAFLETDSLAKEIQSQIARLEAELGTQSLSAEEQLLKNTELMQLLKEFPRLQTEKTEREKRAFELEATAHQVTLIEANLDVISNNVIELFFIGYFFGIILAQVSGKLFYNGAFYDYFKNNPKLKTAYNTLYREDNLSITHFQMKASDDAINQQLEKLETNYFRFLEIAMNMVLPFCALTLTLLAIAATETSLLSGVFSVVAFLVTLGLFYNARGLYVGYAIKKADIMQLLLDKNQTSKEPVVE